MSDIFSFVAFASARFRSSVRVMMTRIFCLSRCFFNFRAIVRLTSFSFVPATPIFPGSFPPCPLSIHTVYSARSAFFVITANCADPDIRIPAITSTVNKIPMLIFLFKKTPNTCNLTYNVFGESFIYTYLRKQASCQIHTRILTAALLPRSYPK